MSAPARPPQPPRMTADEFLVWSQAQGDARYELVAGEVVAMAPERFAHADAMAEAWLALCNAIAAAGLPCRAHIDGAGLRVDDGTLYIPDVMVRCGPPPPPDARETDDAVIVVEVLSPATERLDVAAKLQDYFRVPGVAHYLILRVESGAVIHHARAGDGTIVTAVRREGPLVLDPPGLTLEVAALFGGG